MNSSAVSSGGSLAKSVKGVIWGLLMGALTSTLLLLLFAFVFVRIKSVPHQMVVILAMVAAGVGALVAGNVSGRIMREKGLIYGAFSGFFMFVLVTIVGFVISRDVFTSATLIKFLVMVSLGTIGGILGVNRR